jgi:hypothetical protein
MTPAPEIQMQAYRQAHAPHPDRLGRTRMSAAKLDPVFRLHGQQLLAQGRLLSEY